MTKVLMVSKACYVAAYRKKLEELASFPGMELTLVTPPYWRTGDRKAYLEAGNDQGYRMVVENPVRNGDFHLHFYPGLPALMESLRPDIVHIDEEPYDFVTFHAFRAARKVGAKTIFFTWQNIERSFPLPFSWFEHRILKGVHGALAGSQDAARILRNKGYSRPLYVIPQFGIDPDLFFAREPEDIPETFTPERPFRIGFSGRLVEEKGLLTLFQALVGLRGSWDLRLVGDGPYRAALEDGARSLGIAERVHLLGGVPSNQVPEHLRSIDVLVNPSLTWQQGKTLWKEQFGRSLVEAMACQVPVVGSDSGEIPNVVADAGLIAPEGDVAALRAHLQSLMDSSGLRRSLGTHGRQRVLQHYTHRRIAEQTYACYQQLLDAP